MQIAFVTDIKIGHARKWPN